MNMLSPKKTKFRKQFKGRIHGNSKGNYALNYGSFGLKALEPERVTSRQIEAARKAGDSLGGIITCVARGVPAGLGAPVFDKLKADLAKGMMSIPATMGFQIGSGFESVNMTGSEHNDAFYKEKNQIRTKTNRSGGIQGGISNGEDIVFQVAFKPTGTIFKEQDTVTNKGKEIKLKARGRHDPCVLPRAVPIIDAMTAIIIMDHYLRQKAVS